MMAEMVRLFLVGGSVCMLGWLVPLAISVMVEVGRYRARKAGANPLTGMPGPPRL